MRKLIAPLCVVLALAVPRVSAAAPIYVYDGGLGTWSDVNKVSVNGAPDSFLCWAAAASDVLAWTGWRGWDATTSTYIETADTIYAQFSSAWANTVGSPTYAYEYWMTNRTESIIQDPANPGQSAKVFPSAGLNFYPTVHVQDGDPSSVTAFVKNTQANTIYNFLNTYIGADRGIVASIDVPSGPGTLGPYSHAVTVWGWDPIANEIYITDSDDGLTALRTYSFYQSGGQVFIRNYSNLYTNPVDVEITQLTRLNRNDGGIEPEHGEVSAVPEPATWLLVGTGLMGLLPLRKRAGQA